MSAKSNTEVIIGGKVYTLSGYEGEEYLQRVAAYINNKISDFNEMKSYRRLPADMRATLVQLNVADDYFKAKDRIEKLEQDLELLEADLERKEKELYELKHELISIQIKAETSEKNMEILKIENSKLEAALKASTETKEKK